MVTYRTDDPARWGTGKGANLTASEIDGNFWQLAQRLVAVETNPAAPNQISAITVVGSQMSVHMEDGTTYGPFTLPTAMIHYRGDWAPGVSYEELDIVAAPGGIYLAARAHVSGGTFDAQAVDTGGSPLYQWLFPTQATGLAGLKDVQDGLAPEPGHALVHDGTSWGTRLMPLRLGDLSDVLSSVPDAGQVLSWDGSVWAPMSAAVDGGGSALGDLTDVTLAALAAGQVLRFDGTAWGNAAAAWADIAGKPATINAFPAALGAAGQVIKVDAAGTGLLWAADESSGTGGASDLDGLSDVALSAPAAGQVLKFDGTAWTNQTDQAGTGGGALNDLADVTVTTPTTAQFLRHDGAGWVNAVAGWADVADRPTTFPPSAHSHAWAEVTEKPTTFPPSAHSHAWAEVTEKPTTFPPSAHSHPWQDVTAKPATVAALPGSVGAVGQVLKAAAGGTIVWGADEAGSAGGGGGSSDPVVGTSVGAHRYWRLDAYEPMRGPVSGWDIAIFDLIFRLDGVAVPLTSGAPIGNAAALGSAFDGVGSGAANGTFASIGKPIKVGFAFPEPQRVNAVYLQTYYPTSWGPALPGLFDILFSDDGVSFTKLASFDLRSEPLDHKTVYLPEVWGRPIFVAKAASYQIGDKELDGRTVLELDAASANTVTIPAGLTGRGALLIVQRGTGITSIVAGTGVTLRSCSGLRAKAQFGAIRLIPRGSDIYYVTGDLMV